MPAPAARTSGFLAVFRCDASARIGAGHVMRCLTLADALSETGWTCAFACGAPTTDTVPALLESPHERLLLDGEAETEAAALAARWPDGCDLLVADHYQRDTVFEAACRPWARRIMAIDDIADRPHHCDVLLDQNLGRRASDYDGLVADHCRRLTGARFALLRPQFAAARRHARRRREIGDAPRRILVSLGATDPDNVTTSVLHGIGQAGIRAEIDVVLGRSAPHLHAVRALAMDMPGRVTVHAGVDDMATLMSEADLAVGAAGSSSWERCCLGLPTVLMVIADNQRPGAAALAGAGAVVPVESTDAVGAAVKDLWRSADRRHAMATAAGGICDGYGTARILIGLLIPEPARDGTPVTLRLATEADSSLMFGWQCDDRIRRFSRDSEPPTWDRHQRWLKRFLDETDRVLALIEHAGETAGILRFDPVTEGSGFEISILVAPERHGRGIGRAALALARKLFLREDLYAEVLPGNAVSHALFQDAGYRPVREGLYVNVSDTGKVRHVR
jgi:UDP-2,4-diacetamido-2,4,6-trideoxy-beta-L-altropyranose hydrolase